MSEQSNSTSLKYGYVYEEQSYDGLRLHHFSCAEHPLKQSGVCNIATAEMTEASLLSFFFALSLFHHLSVLLFLACFIYLLSLSLFSPPLLQSLPSCHCQRGMTTICSPPALWHLETGWDTTTRVCTCARTHTHHFYCIENSAAEEEETRNEV